MSCDCKGVLIDGATICGIIAGLWLGMMGWWSFLILAVVATVVVILIIALLVVIRIISAVDSSRWFWQQ